MSRRTQRWLYRAFILLLIGFVALNILARNHVRSMMQFSPAGLRTNKPEELATWSRLKVLITGVNMPRPVARWEPSDLSGACRVLKLEGVDSTTLEAWYCNQGESTPLVILFHGYAAEKTSLIQEAQALLALGASILLVDFRGSGGSSESYTTVGYREADDVMAVVRYARRKLKHDATILFGKSMGGVAIMLAVHKHGLEPDGIIIEAIFDTMLNTIRNRFNAMDIPSFPNAELIVYWGGKLWGFNGFKHNPVDYATSLSCPSLFMHGTDDPRATLAEGRRVFQAATGPKQFKAFGRTGHESYVASHPHAWRAAVSNFLMTVNNRSVP